MPVQVSDASDRVLRSTLSLRTFIAGIDVDRRLWRDLLRPLHVVPAPPQAVTLPVDAGAAESAPTMATTNLKSGALAIHQATVGDIPG